jgi:hypothetical protein
MAIKAERHGRRLGYLVTIDRQHRKLAETSAMQICLAQDLAGLSRPEEWIGDEALRRWNLQPSRNRPNATL